MSVVLRISDVRRIPLSTVDGHAVRINLKDGETTVSKVVKLTLTRGKVTPEAEREAMGLVLRAVREAVIDHTLRALIDRDHAKLEKARLLLLDA